MKHLLSLPLLFIILLPTPSSAQPNCVPTFNGTVTYIDNFAFHTMVNTYSWADSTGYISYPDSVFTTTLTLGETYPITISAEYPAGIYGTFGAWLDYNNDSIFDASERIHYDSLTHYTTSGMVTVPNNPAFVGQRKLRVMHVWATLNVLPCGSYTYGEAEDYVVEIIAAQPDSQTYCMPFSPEGSSNFIIDDFEINTLSNLNSGVNNSSYIIYPPTQFTTTLVMGINYPVYVSKGISAGNTGSYAVWIDLDNDGEMLNTEMIFSAGPGLTSANGIIQIPYNTSYIGERRLRVRSNWGSVPMNPCGLFASGEAEDYFVTIADTITSLSEQPFASNRISLYPNPSRGNVTIHSAQPMDDLIITDVLGRTVLQLKPSTNQISIELEQQGIYFVTITSGETRTTSRLLVTP